MDEHKPPEQLAAELKEASQKVTIGATYSHYKSPTSRYTVKGLAVMEADDSICVIYQSQSENKHTFVRPLKEWLETVEWEGRSLPRFKKLSQ